MQNVNSAACFDQLRAPQISCPATSQCEMSTLSRRESWKGLYVLTSCETNLPQGSRAHTFWNRTRLRKIAFIRLLVFMLYICAIIFVITVQLMFTGLNLKTEHDCRAAIYICLVFYISCKILVQMFLIERAHAARYMLKQRRDDWMWCACANALWSRK